VLVYLACTWLKNLFCCKALKCLASLTIAQFVADEEGSPNNNEFIISVTVSKGSSDNPNSNLREATATRIIRLRAPEEVSPWVWKSS